MNKNNKNKLTLCFIFLSMVVVLSGVDYYFDEKTTETFYERVNEDFHDCVHYAKKEARDVYWCKEIKGASDLAFNSAKRVSNSGSINWIILPLAWMLMLLVLISQRKDENVEDK